MGDQRFLSLFLTLSLRRLLATSVPFLARYLCTFTFATLFALLLCRRSVRTYVANLIEILVQIARARVAVRVREPPFRDRMRFELEVTDRTFLTRNTDFYTFSYIYESQMEAY